MKKKYWDNYCDSYWDKEAVKFDSIYCEDGKLNGWLNKFLRRDMEGRYIFALSGANFNSYPFLLNVLEIGCGTGIHTKGFLEAGAASVTGVDFSREMLKIAEKRLSKVEKYKNKFNLIKGDFIEINFNQNFDIVTAIGIFDYIADPIHFMEKAMDLTLKRFIATFPRAGTLRSRLRAIRLGLKGCPVYFYTKEQIMSMAEKYGAKIEKLEIIGQLYCVIFAH